MSDFDKASAGDYDAIASRLREWAADVEAFLVLPYWEADYESVQRAKDDMLALANALSPERDA